MAKKKHRKKQQGMEPEEEKGGEQEPAVQPAGQGGATMDSADYHPPEEPEAGSSEATPEAPAETLTPEETETPVVEELPKGESMFIKEQPEGETEESPAEEAAGITIKVVYLKMLHALGIASGVVATSLGLFYAVDTDIPKGMGIFAFGLALTITGWIGWDRTNVD